MALNLLPVLCMATPTPNHMFEHAGERGRKMRGTEGPAVIMPAWMKWHKSRNLGVLSGFLREIFGVNSADEGIAAFSVALAKSCPQF